MNREINAVFCSCGSKVEESEPTLEDEEKYGCGRAGCCVREFWCFGCGTRFVFVLEAPEPDYS